MAESVVVTFGEIMGRFCPDGHLRLEQVMPGSLGITFGGAESNVAGSLARLGLGARYVTALPNNPITEACLADLKGHGIDTTQIQIVPYGRFGLYFVERGANQRPSTVTYDRSGTSISTCPPDLFDWRTILDGASWLHLSGITPALSESAAESCVLAAKTAHEMGLTVSFDLNFRGKLWQWSEGVAPRALARTVVPRIMPYVHVLIGNEGDADDVLDIRAGHTDVERGELDVSKYPEVAQSIATTYPNLTKIAITLRESLSADHNRWGAMLYDVATQGAAFAPEADGTYTPYEIRNIVDRVGGGDSFAAGLIRMLAVPDDLAKARQGLSFESDDAFAVAFAVAASCLAHSIEGDYNRSSFGEVMSLVGGSGSGRVVR